jgi:hypothetical protein
MTNQRKRIHTKGLLGLVLKSAVTNSSAGHVGIVGAVCAVGGVGERERSNPMIEAIENHPEYETTHRRWLSVCLATGHSREEAEERAKGYAVAFCSRQIERARYYQGKRPVGPLCSLADSTRDARGQSPSASQPSAAVPTHQHRAHSPTLAPHC